MSKASLGWHPEDIKSALRKRHGLISSLSASWGISPSGINSVLANPRRSTRIEKLIAEAIGEPPHKIWPDRWNPDGTPKKWGQRPPATTRLPPPNHPQKRQAA